MYQDSVDDVLAFNITQRGGRVARWKVLREETTDVHGLVDIAHNV